jgi:hypothetical protein
MHADLVVVASCGNRPEAELAKSVLDAAGIAAMIQADTAGGMREHLAWSGAGFRILVREEDAVAARQALRPTTENDDDSPLDGSDQNLPSWKRFT